jgi:hypothetical protein
MRIMQEAGMRWVHPELKALVLEASRALARLDAERLEELAISCQALNRDLAPDIRLARQAREAAGEMSVFARVLDVTRTNLKVMYRLRELRAGRTHYGEAQAGSWARTEAGHGDN